MIHDSICFHLSQDYAIILRCWLHYQSLRTANLYEYVYSFHVARFRRFKFIVAKNQTFGFHLSQDYDSVFLDVSSISSDSQSLRTCVLSSELFLEFLPVLTESHRTYLSYDSWFLRLSFISRLCNNSALLTALSISSDGQSLWICVLLSRRSIQAFRIHSCKQSNLWLSFISILWLCVPSFFSNLFG